MGIKYKFQKGKDGSAVKALVKEYTLEELQALTKAMFQDKWGRENASLANLRGSINKWRLKAQPAIGLTVAPGSNYSFVSPSNAAG